MGVRIDIAYQNGLRCQAVHGPSGQSLYTDAPVDNHGKGESFSPTDLVATALGACLATIMGIVAEREAIDLTGTKIQVVKEMVADPKRRIGKLAIRIEIQIQLTSGMKAKLEQAARSCPVKESLRPDIETPMEFIYP
jgi:putative redox protein